MSKFVFTVNDAAQAIKIDRMLAAMGIEMQPADAAPVAAPAALRPPAKAPVKPAPQPARSVKRTAPPQNVAPTAERVATLLAAVRDTDGSISAIVKASGLSLSAAQRGLKALRADGQVYMGGEKKWARYGMTQHEADERSRAAMVPARAAVAKPIKRPARVVVREPAEGGE